MTRGILVIQAGAPSDVDMTSMSEGATHLGTKRPASSGDANRRRGTHARQSHAHQSRVHPSDDRRQNRSRRTGWAHNRDRDNKPAPDSNRPAAAGRSHKPEAAAHHSHSKTRAGP